MARFVLVHGAWHGGWCFRRVVGGTRRPRHEVATPDLPCDEVGLTPVDYARVLGPQPDAVVVGHSLGGLTIAHVEARARVYLAALPPLERRLRRLLRRRASAGSSATTSTAPTGRMRTRRPRGCTPTAPARSPTGPSHNSAAGADPAGRPARSGATTSSSRRSGTQRSIRDWQVRTARAHGARVIELDAGHSPFLTQPEELAALLSSLA